MPNRAVTNFPHTGDRTGTAGVGVTAEEKGGGIVHQTVLTMTALSLASVDHTTNGANGSLAVYAFPRGLLTILGATTNLTLTRVGTAIQTTAAVVCGIGSAASGSNDTLTSTEQDIIPSTATTLSSGTATWTGQSTSTELAAGSFDATTTGGSAKSAYLNFTMPDAGSSGNDSLSFTGTITITWVHNGDA